jgi:hypothetical protein
MNHWVKGLVCTLLVASAGCYHATIETGLQPGTQTLEDRWADGWVYGLVPPSTIETMERCPTGVARVETQLSFLNQLVNILTFGIYTPMEIVVTCAAGEDEEQDLPQAATEQEFKKMLDSGDPFVVEMR